MVWVGRPATLETMICSSSESVEALYKAAKGAGFPVASAKQAAVAAVWLQGNGERFGLGDGFAMMIDAVEVGPTADWGSQVSFDPIGQMVTAGGASVIDLGPCVLDLLVGDPDCRSAQLTNVEGVGLFLGLALAGHAEHRLNLSMSVVGDRALTARCEPSRDLITIANGDTVLNGSDVASMVLEASGPAAAVEVPGHLWARASELALTTHVPTTEASRLRGAGAGLTDND